MRYLYLSLCLILNACARGETTTEVFFPDKKIVKTKDADIDNMQRKYQKNQYELHKRYSDQTVQRETNTGNLPLGPLQQAGVKVKHKIPY